MNPKIKKQIHEEALRRFPKNTGYYSEYDNLEDRANFINICEWYHNNIKESVNEKLREAVELIIKDAEHLYNNMPIESFATFIDNAKHYLSASNQENNEGWISVEDRLPNDGITVLIYTNAGGTAMCFIDNGLWRYCWTSQIMPEILKVTHWKEINPPKEK